MTPVFKPEEKEGQLSDLKPEGQGLFVFVCSSGCGAYRVDWETFSPFLTLENKKGLARALKDGTIHGAKITFGDGGCPRCQSKRAGQTVIVSLLRRKKKKE